MNAVDARPCTRCGNTTEPILVPCETPQCEDSVACAARAKSSNSEPTTEPGQSAIAEADNKRRGEIGLLAMLLEKNRASVAETKSLGELVFPDDAIERDRARYAAAQSAPRNLTPDPKDGTRAGWGWCASCQSIQPPAHTCYPRKRRLEPMTDEQAEFERMAAGHG